MSRRRWAVEWGILAVVSTLSACSSHPENPRRETQDTNSDHTVQWDVGVIELGRVDATAEPDLESPISGLLAIENPANVLSYFVFWQTSGAADTRLDVSCDDGYDVRFEDAAQTTSHEVFVMGLRANAVCELVASSELDAMRNTAATTIEVADLPDFLPPIQLGEPPNLEQMRGGWTLFNLSNARDSLPSTGAAVDESGQYRWYHQIQDGGVSATHVLSVVEGGVLFGGSGDIHSRILDWDGTTRWLASFNSHHEALLTNRGRDFYHIRNWARCPQANLYPDYPVVIWDIARNNASWRWMLCEHYTPAANEPDWSHINGVDIFPDEKAVVVSSRDQNALFRVDLETGKIDWTMGYAGRIEDGWGNGDFDMAEDDRFQGQHAPEILPNGNILIFDNGACAAASCRGGDGELAARGWSRAIEIAYDSIGGTAEVVWEFRPEPNIFARILGDADRLEGGNTLVTFGLTPADGLRSHIIEATPSGEQVWEIEIPSAWVVYRADRIEPYYGRVTSQE